MTATRRRITPAPRNTRKTRKTRNPKKSWRFVFFVFSCFSWRLLNSSRESLASAEDADARLVRGFDDRVTVDHQRSPGIDGQERQTGGLHRLDRRDAHDRHVEAHVLIRLRHLDDAEIGRASCRESVWMTGAGVAAG